jgi:hypothetical protein
MTLVALLANAVDPWFFDLISAKNPFWGEYKFLAGDKWDDYMKGLRGILTMFGAFFLLYEMRAARLRERIPQRWKRRLAVVFTVLAFGVYFDFFNPNTRYSEYYHRHEFFHYYLGSKYSNEVGYDRLYECAAAAEMDLGRAAQVKKRDIRDLRVNLIKPMVDPQMQKYIGECKGIFTKTSPERWEQWKRDVDWFAKSSAGSYWENMLKDHGYNPPPVWTMTGKFFASFGDAGDVFFKYLSLIDIFFHLGTILLLRWAFGWRVMAVGAVFWGCNAPANFYWTGGAFLRQDWLFFLVASICLAKKQKYMLAGAALTWSALLRVFPVIFFAGWGIIVLLAIIQRYRQRAALGEKERSKVPGGLRGLLELLHPDHRRLIAGAALAAGVLIPVSIAACGASSYKEFWAHTIAVHKTTPLTNTMGLETMLVHDWDGRMRFLRDDNLEDPFKGWKQNRLDRFKARKPLFFLIVAGVFAWTVWALRRTKALWVGVALSLPLVASLTNLTCYYYSMFMVAAGLVAVRPTLGPILLVASGISSLMLNTPSGYYWVDDRFTAQAWLFYILGLMLLFAYSRPFSVERLKAWWDGKPEPKSRPALPAPSPAE